MENKIIILGFFFVALTSLGFYLAYRYGRKTKRFRWREYLALLACPLLFVFALAYFIDVKILSFFLVCSFVGLVSDYVLGFAYHKTLNKRLWEYKRLSLNGYTSLLTLPFWGIIGILFWFISKMVGL